MLWLGAKFGEILPVTFVRAHFQEIGIAVFPLWKSFKNVGQRTLQTVSWEKKKNNKKPS